MGEKNKKKRRCEVDVLCHSKKKVENPPLFEGGKTLSEGTGDSLKGDGTEWQDVY